jgi:hypothetical protein
MAPEYLYHRDGPTPAPPNDQFTRPRRPQRLPPRNTLLPPRVGCNAGFGGSYGPW